MSPGQPHTMLQPSQQYSSTSCHYAPVSYHPHTSTAASCASHNLGRGAPRLGRPLRAASAQALHGEHDADDNAQDAGAPELEVQQMGRGGADIFRAKHSQQVEEVGGN